MVLKLVTSMKSVFVAIQESLVPETKGISMVFIFVVVNSNFVPEIVNYVYDTCGDLEEF